MIHSSANHTKEKTNSEAETEEWLQPSNIRLTDGAAAVCINELMNTNCVSCTLSFTVSTVFTASPLTLTLMVFTSLSLSTLFCHRAGLQTNFYFDCHSSVSFLNQLISCFSVKWQEMVRHEHQCFPEPQKHVLRCRVLSPTRVVHPPLWLLESSVSQPSSDHHCSFGLVSEAHPAV